MLKLEDVLSKSGRDCLMEPPTDQVTWNNLLRQLGTLYTGSALEALKEYDTNSIDAGARNIRIILKRSGCKNLSVMVEDDGNGMYLPRGEARLVERLRADTELEIAADSILRLPKKIGDSARRLDEDTQGEKAIGALAWQTIGDSVVFISKKEGHETVGWSCAYKRKGKEHYYESRLIADSPELAEIRSTQGTTVIISNINPSVMRELSPRIIQRDFGSRFRDPIKEGRVAITIKDERGEYKVEAEEYQGQPALVKTVGTKFGPLFLEIYANPHKNGEIRIKQGIQTLVNNLGARYKSVLECDAWASNVLVGQARADWLTPSSGRQEMENDERAEVFFNELRKYNGLIEEVVARYSEATDPVHKRRFYNAMSKAFRSMLKEDPLLEEILSGRRVSKRGEETDGSAGDGYAPPVGGPGKGKSGGGKGGKGGEYEPGDDGKPLDPTKGGKVRSVRSPTLRFDDDDLGPDVLSKFEEEFSMIVFNNSVPSYMRAMDSEDGKRMYLTALVGKELYGRIYNDSRKLADQIIQFQQSFLRYFE